MELSVGNGMAEILWVRAKGVAYKGDVVVRVYYRPPSQDDDTNELFFEELRNTSRSVALVLMGNSTCQSSTVITTWPTQAGPGGS